jgi:hypothetical protein
MNETEKVIEIEEHPSASRALGFDFLGSFIRRPVEPFHYVHVSEFFGYSPVLIFK